MKASDFAKTCNVERQLLVFPVAAVLLAFASFLFGGSCAPWQWHLAAVAALAAGFLRRPPRAGIRGGLLFLAWMCVFWVGCALRAGASWTDEVSYHFPAVRMLAAGWNPLFCRDPESVLAFAGLEAGECWIDHIVFSPKIVWVFDALAWFFTDDVFNPLEPLLWFVFPCVIARVWRSMGGAHVALKILSVPLLWCIVPNAAHTVDAVVALSAIGLLLCFEETLSGKGVDALSMAVYSFWMLGSKTPGLLHGGFFWVLFLAAIAWKRREEAGRVCRVAAAVAAMLLVCCSAPYLTSVRDYGNPFYPKYSFDAKRFPARNLTADFITERNADAAGMGYCGLYVNAFVSPSLARAWYRWRLGRPDFMPYSRNYKHYPNDVGDGSCPTRRRMRVFFWLSTVWLLFAAGKSWRLPALSVVLCTGAAPPEMLGYIRYIPWWFAPLLFAYIDVSRRARKRSGAAACCAIAAAACMMRPHTLYDQTVFALSLAERRQVLADLFESAREPVKIRACKKTTGGHLKLMFAQASCAAKPVLLEPCPLERLKLLDRENLQVAALLFTLDDLDETRRLAFRWPGSTREGLRYAARACLRTLPRAAWNRIASLWRDRPGRTEGDRQ